MGTTTTHYIMYGVAIRDKTEVKQFFQLSEDNYAFLDQYGDNAYQETVSPTASGLHIIADGMNGEYVVVGKIIQKGLDGLELAELPPMKEQDIFVPLLEIDQQLGTNFASQEIKFFAFTHWH